jgi:oligopeptide/dipeptide ABC transporter ATP-binding protein
MTPDALLDIHELVVHYRRGATIIRAVDGIDLIVERGRTLGLVGESGCGKSTVAKAVVRLVDSTAGKILFDGQDVASMSKNDLSALRPRVQMIFQDPYASLNPRMSVHAWIEEPLKIHGRGTASERAERVRELIARVGLSPSIGTRYPGQLSGGQRQRVGIARALALDPELIVADEPTSALDVSIQAQVLALLEEIQQDLGLSYLFISHDLGAVRQVAHDIAVMYLGRICEIGSAARVLDQPAHPYTVALISAAPVPDPVVEAKRERIILQGDPPSPADPPTGCRFHPRCWLRTAVGNPDVCSEIDPPATPATGGGLVHCHFHHQLHGIAVERGIHSNAAPDLQGGES